MKQFIKIRFSKDGDLTYGSGLPGAAFEALAKHFPQGLVRPTRFEIELENESEDLSRLYSLVESEAGLKPRLHRFPKGEFIETKEFSVWGRSEYTTKEIKEADYCEMIASKTFTDSNKYLPDGTPIFTSRTMYKQKLGSGNQLELFCIDELKTKFQSGGFSGLQFREVMFERKSTIHPDPIWQLWAEKPLPPMLNRKADLTGAFFDIDPDGIEGFYIDDLFIFPSIRYPKALLTELQGIDVVRTCEHFLHRRARLGRTPRIIVSRRFREWCMKEKLRITWIPVTFV